MKSTLKSEEMNDLNQHNTVERRRKIIQKLSEQNQVFVSELSREFDVSEVTIRNDLQQLEEKKLLIRARGGAIRIDQSVSFDQHLGEKHKLNLSEKSRIGEAAAKLIRDSETILIDSGTTTVEIVKHLNPDLNNVTCITNALNIANQLSHYQNINLI